MPQDRLDDGEGNAIASGQVCERVAQGVNVLDADGASMAGDLPRGFDAEPFEELFYAVGKPAGILLIHFRVLG